MDRPHPAAGSPARLVCRRGCRGPKCSLKVRQPVGPLLHRSRPQRAPSPGLSGAQRTRAAWVSAHAPPLRGPRPHRVLQPETATRAPALPTPPQRPSLSLQPAPDGHCHRPTSRAHRYWGRLSINRDCDRCCRFCIALPSPLPSPAGRWFLLQMQSSSAGQEALYPTVAVASLCPSPSSDRPQGCAHRESGGLWGPGGLPRAPGCTHSQWPVQRRCPPFVQLALFCPAAPTVLPGAHRWLTHMHTCAHRGPASPTVSRAG